MMAEFAAVAVTCRRVCGFVVLIPTLLVELTKSPKVPVAFEKDATAPAPSCWTLRAVPLDVLPNTSVLLEFINVLTLGVPRDILF